MPIGGPQFSHHAVRTHSNVVVVAMPSAQPWYMELGHSLEPLEIALHGSIVLLLLVAMPFGRRIFWAAESLTLAVLGVALTVAPRAVLDGQMHNGQLDAVHVFLARGVGAHLVVLAFFWFTLRNSGDDRMFGSLMCNRAVAQCMLLIAVSYSAYHLYGRKGLHFNEKFIIIYGLYALVTIIGNVIHALRATSMGVHGVMSSDWLATSMAMDHAALIITSMAYFAFTTPILRTLIKTTYTMDGVHVAFMRVMVCVGLTQMMASANVANFAMDADRRAHVICRMLTQVVNFCWHLYGHFYLDVFSMFHVTPFMMAGFYITFLLSVYFRFGKSARDADKTQYSPPPSTPMLGDESMTRRSARHRKKE